MNAATFRIDTKVQIDHTPDRKYNKRSGVVRKHHLGEIGVKFPGSDALVWYLPDQLIKLGS